MGAALAAEAAGEVEFDSPGEMREVLERLLETIDSDERLGPVIRAAHLRARFHFLDTGLELDVASADEEDRFLEWSWGDADWEPKVSLSMDSGVANRWLQGRESLAIAIARGRVRCDGEARSTLIFLPAARLLCEPYRRLLRSDYRHLEFA